MPNLNIYAYVTLAAILISACAGLYNTGYKNGVTSASAQVESRTIKIVNDKLVEARKLWLIEKKAAIDALQQEQEILTEVKYVYKDVIKVVEKSSCTDVGADVLGVFNAAITGDYRGETTANGAAPHSTGGVSSF